MEISNHIMCYQYAAAIAASYFVGSIPFGFLIGKAKGLDIRQLGSRNIGATNVTRVVGKWYGKLCFALDFLKGLAPVLAATLIFDDPHLPLAAGAAAILGHMFPVWLRFKGGKGISTAAGVLAALAPLATAAAFGVWAAVFFASGYVSLGSISAAAALPFAALLIPGRPQSTGNIIFFFAIAGLAIWKHRSNIRRLLDGTENNFRKPKEGGRK